MLRITGILIMVTAVIVPAGQALGEAWGSCWGYVDGIVSTGTDDIVINWNTDPANWVLYSTADAYYYPHYISDFASDEEAWDPDGDGYVAAGPVKAGNLARVELVEVSVASPCAAPRVGLDVARDIYAYAQDSPYSSASARAHATHENQFWLEWAGPGDPPSQVEIMFALEGQWYLEGDAEPGDEWWAEVEAWIRVCHLSGRPLGLGNEYHRLEGPGYASEDGSFYVEFSVYLPVDTPLLLDFGLDGLSYATTVPEPASAVSLLGLGLLAACRTRRTRITDGGSEAFVFGLPRKER